MNGFAGRSWARRGGRWALVPVVALGLVTASAGRAEDEIDRVLSEAGKERYAQYCMPCHGEGGAPATAKADLRTYVERHGGKFPAARWIEIVVDADPGNVHASVWERIKRDQAGTNADAMSRGILGQIARYVMSIQAE